MNALLFALGLAGPIASPHLAHAREVSVEAPSDCPSPGEIAQRLDSRAPHGRSTRVAISRTAAGFHGELVFEGETRVAPRIIDAASCGAVLEALDLVIALHAEDAQPAPEPSSAPEASTPAVDVPPDRATTSDGAADKPVFVGLGLAATGTGFWGAQVLAGGSVFVDVAGRSGLGGVSFLEPSARATFTRTLTNHMPASRVSSGETAFLGVGDTGPGVTLTTAALDLCPVGAGGDQGIGFALCAHGEVGAIDVGLDTASSGRAWAALGATARVRWVPVLAGTSVRPFVELGGGFVAPLARDRFHFGLSQSEIVAPAVMPSFGVGIGALVWR